MGLVPVSGEREKGKEAGHQVNGCIPTAYMFRGQHPYRRSPAFLVTAKQPPAKGVLGSWASAKSYSRNLASIEKRAGMAVLRSYSISLYHLPSPT